MQMDSCLQLQCMRVANSSESMQVCTGGKKLFSGKVMFNIDIGEKTKQSDGERLTSSAVIYYINQFCVYLVSF